MSDQFVIVNVGRGLACCCCSSIAGDGPLFFLGLKKGQPSPGGSVFSLFTADRSSSGLSLATGTAARAPATRISLSLKTTESKLTLSRVFLPYSQLVCAAGVCVRTLISPGFSLFLFFSLYIYIYILSCCCC